MATAHIHQRGTSEIIAVVLDGASEAEAQAMMEAGMAGASEVLTVMEPGAGFVRIEKNKIRKITYTT